MTPPPIGRENALAIWKAAVNSVRPEPLVRRALESDSDLVAARRLIVIGAGKAGPGMAMGLESAFADRIDRVEGLINAPAGMTMPLKRILLHPGRSPGVNEPTAEGVAGAEAMLALLSTAGPDDVAVCLISGGGSALLPAPVEGVPLADKLAVTRVLHRSGATIDEMNCVRKHLSRIKGGRLAEAFRGRRLVSLIISDVVGDPLDVIASGPTAVDPTSYEDALAVLARYRLLESIPSSVLWHLKEGRAGRRPETPKLLPASVENRVIGSNRLALDAAATKARTLGYAVIDLGAFVEGETREVATALAGVVRSICRDRAPAAPPTCLLVGGETTVMLGSAAGKGGRNQEFVLAMLAKLGPVNMRGITVLSGGTDGEDGPTDAAGAIADETTLSVSGVSRRDLEAYLSRHDAYSFFEAADGLLKTGLTGTNVMDVRVILVS